MHVAFIPYGKRSEVELLLRDMEAQKHLFSMTKGNEKKGVWIQGQVRVLPFGIYEYVFPKEDMNIVLTTLGFKKDKNRYLGNFKLSFLRKIARVKKTPEFKESKRYLWIKENVTIIPLGIREDGNLEDSSGENKGWKHEAI